MASESAEAGSVSVELPAELAEWVHDRAGELDVAPDVLIQELLASYRTTTELRVDVDDEDVEIEFGEPGSAVQLVKPVVQAAVDGAPETNSGSAVVTADLDHLEEIAAEAAREAIDGESAAADGTAAIEDRLAVLEDDVADKIEDVRERVIEVKREADAKAPADHDHEAIEAVARRVKSLEDEVDALGESVAEIEAGGTPDRLETVETDLEDVQDRLTTVAWIVRDLREAQESDTGETVLSELKREAAAADIARAKCETCGDGVDISLLTEPACPHCEATVSTVEPASGFFSKPTLRAASQLTAGESE